MDEATLNSNQTQQGVLVVPGKKGRQHILTMRGHASRQGAFCLLKPRRPQKYNSKLGCLLMLHYWVVHLIGPQAMWSAGVGG